MNTILNNVKYSCESFIERRGEKITRRKERRAEKNDAPKNPRLNLKPGSIKKWPISIHEFSVTELRGYSPVCNRSAGGTITFFWEKIQRGTFIWSGTFWYKSPKNKGLSKKLPILWRKKHCSEPETKVIFCFSSDREEDPCYFHFVQ